MKIFFILGLIFINMFLVRTSLELYDITQNNGKIILDISERSNYVGCRRVSDNHSYCRELANQWRKELSKNLGIKDTKGTMLENTGE